AGYTRFTEEEGEEEALSSVERFVEGVSSSLPDDARVVKTIGDEVMLDGREVNLASRIVARARGGEVLVSDAVVDPVSGASNLAFEGIGQVKLKGFEEPHQLCRATLREEP
ncbi:MAG TPA: hypothetical protein VE270_13765, partial [Thermoleophilaceae bacterium]|nr:hypothetical protein [Thermoleophilaceae bacterium]